LYEFDEKSGTVTNWLGKQLHKYAFVICISENSKFFQSLVLFGLKRIEEEIEHRQRGKSVRDTAIPHIIFQRFSPYQQNELVKPYRQLIS
jgi:hypothetical protein